MSNNIFNKLLLLFPLLGAFLSQQSTAQSNLAVSSILRPLASSCVELPFGDTVSVRIFNGGPSAASNFDISYSINGGTVVTETMSGTLNSGGTLDYKFNSRLSLSTPGVYVIKVFTSLPGDPSRTNDTQSVKITPKINVFPYCESFENNDGGWSPAGTNSTWTWGKPAKTYMNKAADGDKVWTNGGLTGYYSNSDGSFITSPCYDFTTLKFPQIAFKFWLEVENGWESVALEYSKSGGPWTLVGTANEPNSCNTENWYNRGNTWSGNNHSYPCGSWGFGCNGRTYCASWATGRHCLKELAGEPEVRFRFRFTSSGTTCTAEGFAFDSLCIGEALSPNIDFSATTACALTPTLFANLSEPCVTSVKWDFGDGSGIVSSNAPVHVYNTGGTYLVKMIATSRCDRIDTFAKNITVLSLPNPQIDTGTTALKARYCFTDGPVSLSAVPAGGSFTINGTAQSNFDPAVLGIGAHQVIYRFTDPGPNGCTGYDTVVVEVYQPLVSIDSLLGSYCLTSPARRLTGNPAGGIFEVNGTIDSFINPGTLGLGTHIITYTYTDASGCTGTDTRVIDVVNNLSVAITGLDSTYCKNAPVVALTANPSGGSFRIDGLAADSIHPATLDTGFHQLIYLYTDGGGCSAADTARFYIDGPEARILALDSIYCNTDAPVTFSGAPAGGNFFLDGVSASGFNPASLAAGVHTVRYTIIAPLTGCTDTVQQNFLLDKPTVKIINLLPVYCINADSVVLEANPGGGTFSINGQPRAYFNPAVVGIGNHKVRYTRTNANGCSSSDSFMIEVVPLPALAFVGLDSQYCISAAPVTLNANPSGGAFTIDGVPASTLDPSALDPTQVHTVEYIYIDQNYGCLVSISKQVRIVLPPNISISGVAESYCQNDASFNPVGVPGGGVFVLDNDTITQINPSQLTPGSYILYYTYKAPGGCSSTLSHFFEVLPPVSGQISPRTDTICQGESTTLTFNTSSFGYVWNTGDTLSSIVVSPLTSTRYWVNGRGCQGFGDTVEVIVIPKPEADFEVNPQSGTVALKINAKALQAGKTYLWSVDSVQVGTGEELEHVLDKAGTYRLQLLVDNGNGCFDTISKVITVNNQAKIKIPNVFTPGNADGLNDDFRVYELDPALTETFVMEVYNRWGMLMHRGEELSQSWDGTLNGKECSEGVYYYLVFVKYKDGKEETLSGSVTLIR